MMPLFAFTYIIAINSFGAGIGMIIQMHSFQDKKLNIYILWATVIAFVIISS